MTLTYFDFKPCRITALAFAVFFAGPGLSAQQAAPDALVADMIQKQISATDQGRYSYRYKIHKTDKKGTVERIEIDTPFGNVARTILREGKPLTPEAQKYERERLQDLIDSSSEQKRKLKTEQSSRKDTVEIVQAMRTAMIYTMHPGQPQLPSFPQPQIVLDFKPNPAFDPKSTAQEALRGVEGTVWIDARSHILRRIEAHNTKDFNILFGLAVKVYAGAKLDAEQREYAPGKVTYSKLNVEAKIRELLVKTVDFRTNQEASEFQRLPDGLTLADAAKMLLNIPIPH